MGKNVKVQAAVELKILLKCVNTGGELINAVRRTLRIESRLKITTEQCSATVKRSY